MDTRKTKRELISELTELRQRITELEASEVKHKRPQAELQESEERYRTLFETIRDAVIASGPDGRIISANPAAATMLGYRRPEELISMPASELYPDPKQREALFQELMEKGYVQNYELLLKKEDGTPIHTLLSAVTHRDRKGNILRTDGIFTDITEFKQAQAIICRQRDELASRDRIITRLLGTLDLEERLNTILDEAMSLVQAEMGSIWLYSGEELLLRCWRGIPDEIRLQVLSVSAQHDFPWMREFTVLHEPLSRSGQMPQFAKDAGLQALASIPLTVSRPSGDETETKWLGTLVMASRRREALNEANVAVIKAMAEQLTLAIDHSRQFHQAQQRLVRLGVLREIDKAIIGQLSIHDILRIVIEGVPKKLGADAVAISFFGEDQTNPQVCLIHLPNGTVIEKEAFTLADSLLHWLIERREPVIIHDISRDPRLQMHNNLIRKHKLASYLAMPLLAQDKTIGVLHILTAQPKVFAPEDVEFFQTLAGQTAIALKSAQLFEQARQSEQRYRAVFENVATAMVIIEEDGTISLVNSKTEELLGYSRDELEGKKNWGKFMPKEELGRLMEYHRLRRTGSGAAPSCYESRLTDKEGKVKDVLISIDMIPETKQSVASVLDITERKEIEAKVQEMEALKEIDHLRSELLSDVSHELRTPLSAIKGYTTLLLKYFHKLRRDQKLESLESIDEATDRLTKLIDQLLDMSRLESGLVKLERRLTSIPELITAVLAEADLWAPSHRIQWQFDKTLPKVNADAKRVRQVLENILSNAVKYSREGTTITIRARQEDSELVISIADQGAGIPPDKLARVFERMYRIEQGAASRGGVGLGLAICKKLVETHGGRIWAESKVGQGSTFYFTLPVETTTRKHGHGQKTKG